MKGTLWCLHGAVGMAADWRGFHPPGWGMKRVDLWRFLECCPMSMHDFGRALNAEAADGRWKMKDGRRQSTAGGPHEENPPSTIHHPPSPHVLVGYSMGARLALHALLAGGPWNAAVLVAPHPGLESGEERTARRATDAEWASRALSGDWREFLEEWEGQAVIRGTSNAERPTSNIEWKMADRAGLIARRREVARSFVDWSLGAQEPLWEKLPEIACPVLWCVGERDTKFRALGERAAGLLPRGELWTAPGAGHRVPWETPEAFREKIGEFLEWAIS